MLEDLTPAVFYALPNGREPVREFLDALDAPAQKTVRKSLLALRKRWPAIGMPRVRKFEPGLWELRCRVAVGYVRVFFTFSAGTLVLLHGFVKKSDDTPAPDLKVARQRKADALS